MSRLRCYLPLHCMRQCTRTLQRPADSVHAGTLYHAVKTRDAVIEVSRTVIMAVLPFGFEALNLAVSGRRGANGRGTGC